MVTGSPRKFEVVITADTSRLEAALDRIDARLAPLRMRSALRQIEGLARAHRRWSWRRPWRLSDDNVAAIEEIAREARQ